ncbi:MAG: hypothetical protein KF862_06725 [Chitinophagaceae bacterium]|nr:hypothetical protein [Chitinophagaceae bacterium]
MKNKSLILICSFLTCTLIGAGQVISYSFDPDKVNKGLAAQMDTLYQEDQRTRMELIGLIKGGASQKALDSFRAIIKLKDSANLVFAEQIISKYGWPGAQEIGMQGAQALFLVIQHADLKTQKKYYPLIKQSEKEGKVLSANVAILEDRIAVREGQPQLYGSQGYFDKEKNKTFIYPLKDVENLDSLRKSMGLQPMNKYIQDWDVEAYKSYLPYAEQLLKKSRQENSN